jgi:hypothetical protein
MKRTANSVGDTLIQRQPDDALALALELVAAIEVLLAASGTLRRAFIAADPQALTIAEIVAAMRHGLASTPNVFPFPVTLLELTLIVWIAADEIVRSPPCTDYLRAGCELSPPTATSILRNFIDAIPCRS